MARSACSVRVAIVGSRDLTSVSRRSRNMVSEHCAAGRRGIDLAGFGTAHVTWRPVSSELLGLSWDHLKLEGREAQLSVQGSLSHVGGASLKAPNRHRSYRTVPIPPEVIPALNAWRKAQVAERLAAGGSWDREWDDHRLVFTGEDGRPVRVDTYRTALRRRLEAANLPHVSPHAFRHTYATHLFRRRRSDSARRRIARRHRCRRRIDLQSRPPTETRSHVDRLAPVCPIGQCRISSRPPPATPSNTPH